MDVEQVDVLRICEGRWRNKPTGFVVTTADRPTTWESLDFSRSGGIELVAMKAVSYKWGSPKDNVDELLPAFARTAFDSAGGRWPSPSGILRFPKDIVYRAYNTDGSVQMRGAKQ